MGWIFPRFNSYFTITINWLKYLSWLYDSKSFEETLTKSRGKSKKVSANIVATYLWYLRAIAIAQNSIVLACSHEFAPSLASAATSQRSLRENFPLGRSIYLAYLDRKVYAAVVLLSVFSIFNSSSLSPLLPCSRPSLRSQHEKKKLSLMQKQQNCPIRSAKAIRSLVSRVLYYD